MDVVVVACFNEEHYGKPFTAQIRDHDALLHPGHPEGKFLTGGHTRGLILEVITGDPGPFVNVGRGWIFFDHLRQPEGFLLARYAAGSARHGDELRLAHDPTLPPPKTTPAMGRHSGIRRSRLWLKDMLPGVELDGLKLLWPGVYTIMPVQVGDMVKWDADLWFTIMGLQLSGGRIVAELKTTLPPATTKPVSPNKYVGQIRSALNKAWGWIKAAK